MATFIGLDGTVGEIPTSTLPAHLAKKQRVTSPEQILAKERSAHAARSEILKERVDQAKAHDAKVSEAQALKASFKKNGMEILGAGEAVPLPAHLEARLESLPAQSTAEQLLEKEQSAHAAREQLLSARVDQAKAHDARVAEVQALKASFKDNGLEILGAGEAVPLPKHLQARLDSLPPKPTSEQLLEKEQSAHAAREQLLSARVAGCSAHEARAAEVRERKTEYTNTGVEVMGAGEAVVLPPHLQARLDSMPKRTAEEILARGAKASAKRDILLGEKVASAREHDALVQSRLNAKKRKAEVAAAPVPMEE